MTRLASAGLTALIVSAALTGTALADSAAHAGASFVLPPVPRQTATPAGPHFRLRRVRISGNTVLPDRVIAEVTAPFIGRDVGTADLDELRFRLTQAYVARGYVNSGAVLPDQRIRDGAVTFRMVEGRLTGIEVTGTRWLSPGYVRAHLSGLGAPLNVNDIEGRIQLLLQEPAIERLNVELVPGAVPGEARLLVDVVERRMYSLAATVANDAPPSVGSIRGQLNGVLRDLTGWGDVLGLHYGRTAGANEGAVAWTMPVTAGGTAVNLRWDYDGDSVVSEPFQGLDIRSITETYGISVTTPLLRTISRALTLTGDLERRGNDTFLLGEPFSFSPGFVNGHASASILRVSLDWLDRRPEQVLALRSTVSRGLAMLGASNPAIPPNADFTVWLGQVQFVHSLPGASQIIGRAAAQLSTAPLLPFEQLAIGGVNTVRGYPENALVRDNGVLLSLEARVPLFDLSIPHGAFQSWRGPVLLAPFIDYGAGWNTNTPTPGPHTIAGIGVGLRWEVEDAVSAQLYYGYGLVPMHQPDHDLQDMGIYFGLTVSVF